MEKLGIALLVTGCVAAVALWIYGVYCYVQMVRHRVPGTNPFQLAWFPDQLTQRGREFRRRALRSYAWLALLGILLFLLTTILGTR